MECICIKNFKNILIIRPDALGDMVLTLPAIHAVRKHFPDAKITVLARPYTRPLLENHPDVDQIIYDYDFKKYNFDLSINFYNEFKDTFATFKAGIPYRIGDSSRILIGWMNNLRVFRHFDNPNRHEIEFNFDLLAPLGIKEAPDKPQIIIDPAALAKARTMLNSIGVKPGDRLAGLQVGAKTSRVWNPAGFAGVADWLKKEKSYKVILLGGTEDKDRADTINALLDTPIPSLVGGLNIPELIAVISLLNFYLGMDTGPSQIAAALNIPMVMLFLNPKARPARWGPYKVRSLTVESTTDMPAEKVIAACDRVISG
jgi:ADP-heptose:LPS heptosyltransferase